MTKQLSIEDMASFCKRKGFVYPTSEIYGGFAGFFDYGPLGVELKNNIKRHWWKTFIHSREDMVGMDGAIIAHPKVWEASGHTDCFADLVLKCEDKEKCGFETRADHFIQDTLTTKDFSLGENLGAEEINKIIQEKKLNCPQCKKKFQKVQNFNLMFETQVGPKQNNKSKAYLRPETAQLIFTNFKLIHEHARLNLPFGIGQIGKAFRNEISPRDFLFRTREFEQMEIEFFVHPDHINDCPWIEEMLSYEMQVLTAEAQEKKGTHTLMKVEELLDQKFTTSWHTYWLVLFHRWFVHLGIDQKHLRLREHRKSELAHYAGACFDIEYQFPFGWKEIHGNADRTQFDMNQHLKVSGKDISVYDEQTKGKVIPYVAAEPSQGVDRAFLAFLFEAYEEKGNIVLHLHPQLAPVQVGIFPLVNKLQDKAKEVYNQLKTEWVCQYDKSGSIGRRYARADEIGIPFCITIDFDSLEKKDCTIRDRESTKQVRVALSSLPQILPALLHKEKLLEKVGKPVEVTP